MKEKTEDQLPRDVLKLLQTLQNIHPGDDAFITSILIIALSAHLWDCKNANLTEQCMNYLANSFSDLFQNMLPDGTITDASISVH